MTMIMVNVVVSTCSGVFVGCGGLSQSLALLRPSHPRVSEINIHIQLCTVMVVVAAVPNEYSSPYLTDYSL